VKINDAVVVVAVVAAAVLGLWAFRDQEPPAARRAVVTEPKPGVRAATAPPPPHVRPDTRGER
jgi:hypothetical protein